MSSVRPALALLALTLMSAGAAPAGPAEQLPNLTPLPLHTAFIGSEVEIGRVLMVETLIENVGDYPLEIRGVPRTDLRADAFQCVERDALCTSWAPAGALVLRQQNACWAPERLELLELRRLVEERPDPSSDGLLASRTPSNGYRDNVRDYDRPGDDLPGYPACVAFLIQGLSPGWIARFQGDEAQHAIPLASVPDGRYALVMVVDPAGVLRETDETDNTTWTIVEIAGDEVVVG